MNSIATSDTLSLLVILIPVSLMGRTPCPHSKFFKTWILVPVISGGSLQEGKIAYWKYGKLGGVLYQPDQRLILLNAQDNLFAKKDRPFLTSIFVSSSWAELNRNCLSHVRRV